MMDQLDFEYHWRDYEALIGNETTDNTEYFLRQAQYMHSLVAKDALRDALIAAVTVAPTLSNEEAKYFMTYGAGRRLRMMWASYREILSRISTDRREPLPLDDVGAVSRDLNVIYINILGVLDNYAWCLLHQVATDETKGLRRAKVGLFSPVFMADANLAKLKPLLDEFHGWNKELKTRRDPVAHRIPLSVPPAALTPEEANRYQELEGQVTEAINSRNFEQVDGIYAQQGRIGTFRSYFLHHPGEGLIPIYPTVPQDIANLIKIVSHVHIFLNERE